MRTRTLLLIALLLVISGCAPSTPISQPVSPIAPAMTGTAQAIFTLVLNPEVLIISVEIEQEYSQEEIAEILYTKWLDHFLSEDINPEMRLDSYVINSIKIPSDQRCAKVLGGTFIAEAEVTAKTFLPLYSTESYERSNWFVAGGGNIVDSYHQIRLFSAVVFQMETTYTLVVITQIPMCYLP